MILPNTGNIASDLNLGPCTGNQTICGGEGAQGRVIASTSGADGANSSRSSAVTEKPSKMGVFANSYNMYFLSNSFEGTHPPGITNPGAVCFVNCVLQTLLRTPLLIEYMDKVIEEGVSNALDYQSLTFLGEVYIIAKMLSKREISADLCGQACFYKSAVNNSNLLKAISKINCLVIDPDSGCRQSQEDAGEFLTWVLYRLDSILETRAHTQKSQAALEELKAKLNVPSSADIAMKRQQCHFQISLATGSDGKTYIWPASVLSDIEWLIYKEPKISVISDFFEGQEVSVRICDACKHVSLTFQEFNVMYLPIPADTDGIIELLECCMQAVAVNILSGSNRPQCDYCIATAQGVNQSGNAKTSDCPGTRHPEPEEELPTHRIHHGPPAASIQQPLTNARKQTSYRHLPECLIIQLLRFDSSMMKNLKRVKVSSDPINLSCLDSLRIGVSVPKWYALYGVCLHSGALDMQSGHYSSISLAVDNNWYSFNDETVKLIGDINLELEDEKIQQNIYLLFYKKVEHEMP